MRNPILQLSLSKWGDMSSYWIVRAQNDFPTDSICGDAVTCWEIHAKLGALNGLCNSGYSFYFTFWIWSGSHSNYCVGYSATLLEDKFQGKHLLRIQPPLGFSLLQKQPTFMMDKTTLLSLLCNTFKPILMPNWIKPKVHRFMLKSSAHLL